MKPFLIIPGLGAPNAERKFEILRQNLTLLGAQFPQMHTRVCVYTPGLVLPADLPLKIDIVHEPGIVGEFLLKHANPEEVAALGCTHVFILLDDIALSPEVDVQFMLRNLPLHNAQIASPCVSASDGVGAWSYMMHDPKRSSHSVLRSNTCELFFYAMALNDYRSYYLGLDSRNPWCWGVDMTLGRLRGLHSLIFNGAQMVHCFKGSGRSTALEDSKAYFIRRGTDIDTVLASRFHEEIELTTTQHASQQNSGAHKVSLDLGSGPKPRNPFNATKVLGLDLSDYGVDVKRCDLGFEAIPHPDNSLDYITAYDLLEHIPRHGGVSPNRNPFLYLMSEIHRCLKPGGSFYARTPAYPNPTAFSDPTHVNFITSDTARYFGTERLGDGTLLRDDKYDLGQRYGFKGHFLIVRNHHEAAYGHQVWLMTKTPQL